MADYLEIPPQQLQPDVLRAVLEEFITREGTDYGQREFTLDEKVAQLQQQLASRQVVLVFDPESESCTLLPRDQL